MARFLPFPGIRYRTESGVLDDLVAPPYDVIGPDERAALEQRGAHNAVRIELPQADGGRDRYAVAASLFNGWRADGTLVADAPSFYVYRMDFRSEDGAPRSTVGVLGALELSEPGTNGIFPHERTTPKDKADRLDILRATGANLSPIWGLSSASGLSALCDVDRPPDSVASDDEGVVHSLWQITDQATVERIGHAVGGAAVVIADGHHRFEVANAYRDEVRRSAGDGPGDHDLILAYMVELAEEQLTVRAIHRLVSNVPPDAGLAELLAPWFRVDDEEPLDDSILSRMDAAGALALVTTGGVRLLHPLPETDAAAEHDLDSSRLDVALTALPSLDVRFQHGVHEVAAAVKKGEADAGVLLRPARVAQIADIARGGARMPPKTTFFYPKLRTGMVFRAVTG